MVPRLATCAAASPDCSTHCAASTALPQGRDQHSPLTLLVSAAFYAQQSLFDNRRSLFTRLFSCAFSWAFLIVAMSISNCR